MTAPTIDRANCAARRHGDYNAYRRGCGCADAREDRRLYMKRSREGRQPQGMVSSVGASRRLQALAALGWTVDEIAEKLGTSRVSVLQLRRGRSPVMTRSVSTRVAAVYDQLSGTPGGSDRVRAHAARAGWAAPLLWEDDTIDDPTAKPVEDKPVWKPGTDLGEVEHLRRCGLSLDEIGQRLGVQAESIRRAEERAQRRAERTPEEAAAYWEQVAAGHTPTQVDETTDGEREAPGREWTHPPVGDVLEDVYV